jgi:hypothetical protein
MLSYRRNDRYLGKPGFSPRFTRRKYAAYVLFTRRNTSWQHEKFASVTQPSPRIAFSSAA